MLYIPWDCPGACERYAADISNQDYKNWRIEQVGQVLQSGDFAGIFINDLVQNEIHVYNSNHQKIAPLDV